ncbi:hypothetical protein TTHERM_00486400 (macronuclear) [Tetrahymena thermophila SB210]|uniref:Uncharacterized protein n=1 Tax=Tetrahymena thermophila (strain SB210) TaxID=312017 RepID=I7LZZ4_TETTS|nr:hypothetical protein TTHERM_00486400 [Tetrahymena thermophila SB210]EAR85189.2 hypothetical protein TTHERM_00486400 [Tetrahymena thermophila SB210]|eukprot:XP_001032852.2 hypothetical protein TTHERM_00486400 [Tetrahymena thermophila SB210]
MDNPQDLLKQASIEENDDKRLKKIVKACKIISESLPFEEISEIIIKKNKELVKYLMINYIFSKNPIKLILASLLEKFQWNLVFMTQFWEALEFCARLQEISEKKKRQKSSSSSFNSYSSENRVEKSQQLKEEISVYQFNEGNIKLIELNTILKIDYLFTLFLLTQEIQENVVAIKMLSLEFIFDLISILVTQHSVKSLDDRNAIFYHYLHYTKNEKLIIHTVELIEKIKKTFLFYFEDLFNFDSLIESVFMQKSRLFVHQDSQEKQKEEDFTQSFNTYQSTQQKSYGGLINPVDVLKIHLLRNTKQDECIDEDDDSEPGSLPSEIILDEQIQEPNPLWEVEKWISSKEVPCIGYNEYMMNFFKQEQNVRLFLNFVFYPENAEPQNFWTNLYPQLKKLNKNAKNIKFYKINSHQKILELKDEMFNIQNFRSYKIIQILKQRQNMRIILNCFPQFFTVTFQLMYDFFLDDFSSGNLNHVAKLIEIMIEFDQDQALLNMVSFNVMFNLLEYIYNPYIFEIVFGISDLASNRYKLFPQNVNLIAEYMNHSTWFQELCSLLLSYDHFEKFKREKNFKTKQTSVIQRILLQKVQENECEKQSQIKKQANDISQILNEETQLQAVINDNKRNIEELNKILGQIKQNIQEKNDDFEYLYYQELNGSLPNIDKIDLNQIKSYKQQKKVGSSFIIRESSNLKEFTSPKLQASKKSSIKNNNKIQQLDEIQLLKQRTSMLMKQSQNENSGSTQFSEKALFKIKKVRAKLTLLFLTNKAVIEARRNLMMKSQIERQKINTDITEENHSLFSTLNGFHSSRLIYPYPNYKLAQVNSDIEQLAKSKDFFSERIIAKEFYSFPCSQVCLAIIKSIFSFQEQYSQIEMYRRQLNKKYSESENSINLQVVSSNLLDMLLDDNAINFERIFMNYLIKMRVLTKLQDITNSSFVSGNIVNIILKNLHKYHDKFDNVYKKIKLMCIEYFDYSCKTIKYLDSNKKDPFILQNLRIKQPINLSKSIVVETLSHIIKIIQREDIFISFTDSIWHTILLWFFNSPTSSIYGRQVVQLLNSTFNYASQKHIMSILFKLSAITCLFNAYEDLTYSNRPIKSYHIDTFIIWIKQIVISLRMIISERKFLDIFQNLQQLTSWQKLQEIIPNSLIENIKQKESYMMSKQNSVMLQSDLNLNKRSSQLSQASINSSIISAISIQAKKYSQNGNNYQLSSFVQKNSNNKKLQIIDQLGIKSDKDNNLNYFKKIVQNTSVEHQSESKVQQKQLNLSSSFSSNNAYQVRPKTNSQEIQKTLSILKSPKLSLQNQISSDRQDPYQISQNRQITTTIGSKKQQYFINPSFKQISSNLPRLSEISPILKSQHPENKSNSSNKSQQKQYLTERIK